MYLLYYSFFMFLLVGEILKDNSSKILKDFWQLMEKN
jgi:hypothetical protein